MPFKTEETFQIRAAPDRVWEYLSDPRQVVSCLPGAELTSVQDASTFLGRVKVKVGPVVAAYSGKVVVIERDDSARVLKMMGEGRENTGAGSAKVVITSAVTALAGGGSEVRVSADLDVVGKIAQFGRGMIESVNKQMFRQFTECVRATLEAPTVAAGASAVDAEPPSGGERNTTPPPTARADATLVAPDTRQRESSAIEAAKPIRLVPLVGRALWDWLGRLGRRIVGRLPKVSR